MVWAGFGCWLFAHGSRRGQSLFIPPAPRLSGASIFTILHLAFSSHNGYRARAPEEAPDEDRGRHPIHEKDQAETSTPSLRLPPLWRARLVHPQGSVSMPVRLLAVLALRRKRTHG